MFIISGNTVVKKESILIFIISLSFSRFERQCSFRRLESHFDNRRPPNFWQLLTPKFSGLSHVKTTKTMQFSITCDKFNIHHLPVYFQVGETMQFDITSTAAFNKLYYIVSKSYSYFNHPLISETSAPIGSEVVMLLLKNG